ncbi:HEAT repeat domain-containing protein [Planctomicrobium sp. SH668]|uniref:HEAT repeat domain-containing protein n=1 Tax=Planctomicrobium sp. SH668 TaxID=3448126 RepID=UPI003F5C4582
MIKYSLLVAPLLMISVSGCATPRMMGSTSAQEQRAARNNRLLSVAEEYEAQGNPEAAMRVYEHVLAQNPNFVEAEQRRDLLASQGVKASPKRGHEQTSPQNAAASQQLYASKSKVKSQSQNTEPSSATEIHRKNAELLAMIAAQKSEKTPVVVEPNGARDQNLVPTPVEQELQIAKNNVRAKQIKDQLLRETEVVADQGWKTTTSSTGFTVAPTEEQQPVAVILDSNIDELKSNWNIVNVDSAKSPKIEDSSLWATTDHTRDFPSQPIEQVSANNWNQTRLAALCEDLPGSLVSVVNRLESSDSATRVIALTELSEMKEAAKPAAVAVYALMGDADPVVAVYAAGALRDITGDAWSSVHTLNRLLESDRPGVAQLASYMLGQMGPEAMDAVPVLTQIRDQSSGLSGLYAAEALTHITPDDERSITKLKEALHSTDRELRWFSAVSLGTIEGAGEVQAAEALKLALADSEEDVRVAACLSLGGLGKNAVLAIPELEKAAQSDRPEVQVAAQTALACLKG